MASRRPKWGWRVIIKLRRFLRTGLTCSLFLAGCASTSSIPEDHFYRLASIEPPERFSVPPIRQPLIVDRIKTYGIYHERAIVYSQKGRPDTLRLHHYRHWIDKPADLLHDQLVAYLRSLGIADSVNEADGRLHGVKLKLDLKRFERRLSDDGKVSAEICMQLQAVDEKEGARLFNKEYSVLRPASDASMTATLSAFNLGLADIYERLAEDLLAALSDRAGNI